MKDFRNLKVWQEAHKLTLAIYTVTADFPRHELYGISSQMRRSAVSIASNIAEGYGRGGDRELFRFITIALGSANELEYQLLLAKDLGYIPKNDHKEYESSLQRLKRRLVVFSRKVQEDLS